jgi:hypothetical protein
MGTYKLLITGVLVSLMANVPSQAQTCNGPGKARWPIRTSLAEGISPNGPAQTIPLDKLLALAAPPGVKDDDPRYQDTRIPKFDNPLSVKEGDLMTTAGWLYLVATEEDDCDYHIQVSLQARTTTNKPQANDDCIIVEAPRPDFVSASDLSTKVGQVRDYIKAKLLAGKEPSNTGSVMQHAVCVRVTGQLFYDEAHVEGEIRGKKGMSSHTLWELHPITAFTIAPPSACPASGAQ